jgi:hypothetical protein
MYFEVLLATTAKETEKSVCIMMAHFTYILHFLNIYVSILDDVGQFIVSISTEAANSCENL